MILLRRTFLLGASALAAAPATAFAAEGDEMTIGAADAPVQLVEYASATCPHCAHFAEINWQTLKANYIDRGRVRLTMHELLTAPPSVAFAMFQLARCNNADAPEYFRRLDILFARQHAILETGTFEGVRDALLALGAEWGVSAEQANAAWSDTAGGARIRRSIDEANQRGISSTPTFVLNGAQIDDPAFFESPEGMSRVLDAHLSRR